MTRRPAPIGLSLALGCGCLSLATAFAVAAVFAVWRLAVPAPAVAPATSPVADEVPVREGPAMATPAAGRTAPLYPANTKAAASRGQSTSRSGPSTGSVARDVPVRVGAGTVDEPKKLKQVTPIYPEVARNARVQGVVILECTISPQGRVVDVKVLRGIPLLTEAAVDAVRQWVYAPTFMNGAPVPVIMTVTVNFRLS